MIAVWIRSIFAVTSVSAFASVPSWSSTESTRTSRALMRSRSSATCKSSWFLLQSGNALEDTLHHRMILEIFDGPLFRGFGIRLLGRVRAKNAGNVDVVAG